MRKTYEITDQRICSGKAVGVIKHSSLKAIEGELVLRNIIKVEETRMMRDKYILDVLMSESCIWKYDEIAAERSVLLSLFLKRLKEKSGDSLEEILKRENERMHRAQRLQGIPETGPKRAYIIAFRKPPLFEVKYPSSLDMDEFARKIRPWCNEATGLSFILDLLNHDIEVERG